jgi:glutamyl endopeptidase
MSRNDIVLSAVFTVSLIVGCARQPASSNLAMSNLEETVSQSLAATTRAASIRGMQIAPAGDYRISGVCEPDGRQEVNPQKDWEKATCLLQIEFPKSAKSYQGTGFLVKPNLILTAGHCVFDHRYGGWASSITVVSGGGRKMSRAIKVYSVRGWTESPKSSPNHDYDYGGVVLQNSDLHNAVGFVFNLAEFSDVQVLSTRGYPTDHGTTQVVSTPSARAVERSPLTIQYQLDSNPGQSGGPVFLEANPGTACAVHALDGCPGGGNQGTRLTTLRIDKIRDEWN